MGIRSGDYWDHGTSKAVQFMVPLGEFNLYNRISNIIALGGKSQRKRWGRLEWREREGKRWEGVKKERCLE